LPNKKEKIEVQPRNFIPTAIAKVHKLTKSDSGTLRNLTRHNTRISERNTGGEKTEIEIQSNSTNTKYKE